MIKSFAAMFVAAIRQKYKNDKKLKRTRFCDCMAKGFKTVSLSAAMTRKKALFPAHSFAGKTYSSAKQSCKPQL
jgi:hypothetical protein